MLIAVCTCPYQSWTNPAEQVMSILNLALQNVSLERKEMDEEAEKLIKNKNNMQAVRDVIKSHPAMKQKVGDSLKPVTDLLDERFKRMKLKEYPFQVADVATESEMDHMFEEIKIVDSSLQQDSLRKKGLVKAKDYQAFMNLTLIGHVILFSSVNVHLTLVYIAQTIQSVCPWKNSILYVTSLFPYLMPVNSTTSLSMCMVSYQLKETDHLCQIQKKLMEMKWIKQTVNFSLQLEGSELHLPVESASSLGVSTLKLR